MVVKPGIAAYVLEEQIGFLIRKAHQRHRVIFSEMVDHRIAPAQFAAMSKLYTVGPTSQNELGRLTAMDGATIKGVVDRLAAQGLVTGRADPGDARRRLVELTDEGTTLLEELIPIGHAITEATLEPLCAEERERLATILTKISGR